jgi:Protein of unknown function (DUF2846)
MANPAAGKNAGVNMNRIYRGVVTTLLALQLAGCAGTAALESQSRQRDTRSARLYFLRPSGVLGAMGARVAAAEIKVDGKSVGAVTNGSYIFVDRPAGSHTISLQNGISMAFETAVQLDAGRDYYYDIAPPRTGGPGMVMMVEAGAGTKGQQLPGQSLLTSSFSGVVLYSLDPATGATELAKLSAR